MEQMRLSGDSAGTEAAGEGVAQRSVQSVEVGGRLLLALADRSDAAVLPAVLEAAGSGSQKLRLTAVGVLDRMGNVSSMPVLLNVAADPDATAIAQAMDGYHRTLPMSYALDAEELAALMRSYGGLDGTQTSSTTSE